ncbi:MAG: zinc ABC transporter substrate-binding protein [Rhodobacteraceae bacterium]|nr:zinc ABC transporter substrate-binding protein [Paracoccaceae bacterium]
MRHTLFAVLTSLFLAPAARAEAPTILTDIAPVQSLAAQVMEGIGTPELLISGGGDPHHVQLRPSQARGLSRADLVIWVGPSLTPWLGESLDSLRGNKPVLTLSEADGLTHRAAMFGDDHDHAHDDDHGDEADDPHFWLDHGNAKVWLGAIAEALAEADPANSALYRANATAAATRLDATVTEAAAILAAAGSRRIVVSHDGWAHFAAAFDVSVVGAISEGDAAAPGAARLSELREMIVGHGADCLFTEVQQPGDFADTLAEGTGIGRGTLDPTGASLGAGPDLYPALILANARAIAGCR